MYTKYSVSEIENIFKTNRSIYFIGIGGISMSSLAHIASQRGCKVSGYDRTLTSLTESLERDGIEIFTEISPEHIEPFDVVVYNAAIKPDHPELAAALEYDRRGEKYCIYRADFLGWLMSACENRIGVSGMHGKSTTTSMISHIFLTAKRDPTIVSGAELAEIGGAYRIGSKRDFIMEACEYQDSFLSFTPNIAVVLNIDLDHTDYFSGLEQIIDSFKSYLSIAGDGYAVANIDDKNVRSALEGYKGRLVSYAVGRDADFTAENINYDHGFAEFDILKKGCYFTHVKLSVTGHHNVSNALAAAAAADICGIDASDISRGLGNFVGAKRRMELRGSFKTDCDAMIPLYDDYAHHPIEIKSTLGGAIEMGYKRLFVVFQPHTYSRTSSLFDEFVKAFDKASYNGDLNVIFADIYAAREQNTFGVSTEQLAEKANGKYLPSFESIAEYLRAELCEGDMLIVMGAGDIIGLDKLLL